MKAAHICLPALLLVFSTVIYLDQREELMLANKHMLNSADNGQCQNQHAEDLGMGAGVGGASGECCILSCLLSRNFQSKTVNGMDKAWVQWKGKIREGHISWMNGQFTSLKQHRSPLGNSWWPTNLPISVN